MSIYDPSFVNVTVVSEIYLKREYTDQILLETNTCDNFIKEEVIIPTYSYELYSSFCVKPNTISMKNFYGHEYFSNIAIIISICSN